MHLVERMTLSPAVCMHCGMGNTADGDTGVIGPFIDLGLDYNWGDSGYCCIPCAGKIAAIAGWITLDEKKDLDKALARKEKEIHELEATRDELIRKNRQQNVSLRRIQRGSQELKKVRKQPVKAKA